MGIVIQSVAALSLYPRICTVSQRVICQRDSRQLPGIMLSCEVTPVGRGSPPTSRSDFHSAAVVWASSYSAAVRLLSIAGRQSLACQRSTERLDAQAVAMGQLFDFVDGHFRLQSARQAVACRPRHESDWHIPVSSIEFF